MVWIGERSEVSGVVCRDDELAPPDRGVFGDHRV